MYTFHYLKRHTGKAKEMHMLRLILSLILWSLICGSAHGQTIKKSMHSPLVTALPAAIYDVKGIGNWRKGEVGGQIRLVITRSKKRDEVFLQWVQWVDKEPKKVQKTVQVKEIQQEANFKTTFIRRETVGGVPQLILGLESLYDKSSSRAFIKIDGVGRYHCHIQ